ncbi:hypothetical protein ES703_43544 [subsurface metagenome]
MRKKGAGMLMTIMLVSASGWVAIVVFIIKPGLVVGAGLSLCGGAVIGLVIVWLIKRWWFRRIPFCK